MTKEVIEDCKIKKGNFDNVFECRYKVPSYTDIGSDYSRLIINVSTGDIIDTLYDVFTSFISDAISNFNSDFFYQNDSYIMWCYKEGKILE